MKWGRRKSHTPYSSPPSSSSSSSRPSFISHILPVSWLSKFKQKKDNQEARPMKVKGTEKRSSPRILSPDYATGNGGRFYSGDDAEFWKLSFGEDDVNAKKSEGVLRSVWYDSEEEHGFPRRICRSKCTEFGGKEEIQNLNNMVSKMTRRRRRREAPSEVSILRREFEIESRTPRSRYAEHGNLSLGKTVCEKRRLKPPSERHKEKGRGRELVGKNMLELEEDCRVWTGEKDKTESTNSRKHQSRNYKLRTIEENCVLSSMKTKESDPVNLVGIEVDSEWERMKELKIEEMKSRSEKQRRSLYLRKESSEKNPKSRRKVRVYSPRTAKKIEICKIKALEDMKKSKLKMKKKVKERGVEDETDLESFAVVKCSFDPQQDFRDSMVEMIMERGISKAEELEELLACYLTLNSDQYHDLIIKVFRQVWFDLNRASLESVLENQFSCNDQQFS